MGLKNDDLPNTLGAELSTRLRRTARTAHGGARANTARQMKLTRRRRVSTGLRGGCLDPMHWATQVRRRAGQSTFQIPGPECREPQGAAHAAVPIQLKVKLK